MAYLAPSLVALRNSVNAAFPHRDKTSDGWIGDAAHAATKSEHNPDAKGCVHAIDVDIDDNDAGRDLRTEVIAACKGHRAVWYIISNGVIYSRTYGWAARKYTGASGHFEHVHVSIQLTASAEGDATLKLTPRPGAAAPPAKAPAKPPAAVTGEHKLGSRALRVGARGNDVAYVQRFLGIGADGIFGSQTDTAVKRYQGMRGLHRDGIVGTATWAPMLRATGR